MRPRNVKTTLKSPLCPECGDQNGLRQILYGLPDGPPDPEMYRLGGCCVEEGDPEVACISCGWEGNTGEKRSEPND